MATVRERKPGVWEVRAFTGRDERGRPTQISRTVRGTKRDALRVAAELTVRPVTRAASATVTELLAQWVEQNEATWAASTRRDNPGRAAANASYGEHWAVYGIDGPTLLAGSLPARARRMVEEWASQHPGELLVNWQRARADEALLPIDPLP